GVRGVDDRTPRTRAEEQLHDVATECEGEELPLHRRQVVEEDRDRMEELAHREGQGSSALGRYDPGVPATSHGIDEYLETIYFLAFPIGEYRPVTDGSSQAIAS